MRFYSSSLEYLHYALKRLDKFVKNRYYRAWRAGEPLQMSEELKRYDKKRRKF